MCEASFLFALDRWRRQSWLAQAGLIGLRFGYVLLLGAGAAVAWGLATKRDVTPLLITLTSIVGVSIVVAVFRARPTRAQIAARADEHFGLKDLLSTALRLPKEGVDPWQRLVAAQAAARAETLRSEAFPAAGSNTRPAVGLLLGALAVATLAAIAGTTAEREWNGERRTDDRVARGRESTDNRSAAGSAAGQRRNTFEAVTTDENGPGERASALDTNAATAAKQADGDDAAGGGKTNATAAVSAFSPAATTASPAGTRLSDGSGVAARSTALGVSTAGSVSSAPGSNVPGGRIDRANAQRDDALHAVITGRVPDGSRGLVRAFFER